MALAGFIWAVVLLVSYAHPERQAFKRNAILAFVFEGIAAIVAGVFHQEYAVETGTSSQACWRASMAILTLAGLFRMLSALDILQLQPRAARVARILTMVLYGGIAILLLAIKLPFLVGGFFGGVLPVLVFQTVLTVRRCQGGGGELNRAWGVFTLGFVLFLAGVGSQVTGAGPCGTKCPVDCPWDAPNFNHNAVFHVFQLFFVVLSGVAVRALLSIEPKG